MSALNATQDALAVRMRTAWANFAASGNPSAPTMPWPSLNTSPNVLSLESPQPQLESDFDAVHHCAFWGR